MDENNTLLIHVTFVPEVTGKSPVLPQGMEFPVANLVETLFLQDYRAVVSQGRSFDRTKERLGTTDRGVILLRRMIMDGLEAVAGGKEPDGVLRGSAGAAILNSAEKVTDGMMSVRAAE